MRKAVISALVPLLPLSVFAPLCGAVEAQQSWTARYLLPAGGRVAVANVLGSIKVEGWDRPEVELTAVVTGAEEQVWLEDVSIVVEAENNALQVRTLYRAEGEDPVAVNYSLRVPRQVRLEELRTLNGDIEVREVEGWVAAHTLNGNIEQTGIAGSVVARTVNGDVRVALRALPDREGALELETLNGDLYLRLPAQANADLELSTVAGRIESQRLLPARAAPGDSALRVRLGRGGVPIRLRTIRGDIRVSEGEDVL